VLTHVQGHRVTQDIDAAARGFVSDIREQLLLVTESNRRGAADLLLPNGVPVDLLVASDGDPRPAAGRGARAKRREAAGHAIRWASGATVGVSGSVGGGCGRRPPRGPGTRWL
jgi:hypothetical protein